MALQQNVVAFIAKHGLERCGFLTLTTADQCSSPQIMSERFRSLRGNVIRERYGPYMRVYERQKSGAIHFHLLICVHQDIRTGFDFDAVKRRDYRSASRAIRDEWKFWRATAPKYGFGRCELLPIRKTAGAIGCYLGKYIAKHIENRRAEDKGVRLVDYGRAARAWTCRFAFSEGKAARWRENLAGFANVRGIESYEQLRPYLGKRWAFQNFDAITRFHEREQPTPYNECRPIDIRSVGTSEELASASSRRRKFEAWDMSRMRSRSETRSGPIALPESSV